MGYGDSQIGVLICLKTELQDSLLFKAHNYKNSKCPSWIAGAILCSDLNTDTTVTYSRLKEFTKKLRANVKLTHRVDFTFLPLFEKLHRLQLPL